MKVKVFFIFTMAVLFLSACGSSRFGYIPKGKRQKGTVKKQAIKWRKQKQHQIVVRVEKPSFSFQKDENSVTDKERKKPVIPKLTKKKSIKSIVKATKLLSPIKKTEVKARNKKAATNRAQKTTEFDFWESFLGELVFLLLEILIGSLIIIFFAWLFAVGLGWLAYLLVAVLIIMIFLWIVGELEDILDFMYE